ncbi:MAG: MoaD/ThiS family protein [Kordiimonadaceae bacterium]|nr:MoaD/ThiS family protein [Kordiimonadaceae bacterium]
MGKNEEDIGLPDGVSTVSNLLDHLCEKSAEHSRVLKERVFVRVAVNQTHVDHDHPVTDGDEVAIFPPVTGG